MSRRYTTRAQDLAFLREVFEDSTRTWQIGDLCRPAQGRETTSVARIEGSIVHLANGQHLHITRMRRPIDGDKPY